MELKVASVVRFECNCFCCDFSFHLSSCLMWLVIAWYVSQIVVFYVQQNSVTLNYHILWIMRQNLYWLELKHIIFFGAPIFGVYSWSEEYSIWISAGSLSLHFSSVLAGVFIARGWWMRRQGVRRYHSGWCRLSWRPFCTCPWDIPFSLISFFLMISKT
jgi:hypothetical protein